MKFGQRITALRTRKGMTQDQMAEALGIKRARYNAWENNISEPDHEMLSALAQFHGVTVDFLLGRPHPKGVNILPAEMYADGFTDESFFEDYDKHLEEILKSQPPTDANLSIEERELILLYRQTDKIPDEEREKLKNTIADTIELYLARKQKN